MFVWPGRQIKLMWLRGLIMTPELKTEDYQSRRIMKVEIQFKIGWLAVVFEVQFRIGWLPVILEVQFEIGWLPVIFQLFLLKDALRKMIREPVCRPPYEPLREKGMNW